MTWNPSVFPPNGSRTTESFPRRIHRPSEDELLEEELLEEEDELWESEAMLLFVNLESTLCSMGSRGGRGENKKTREPCSHPSFPR